MGLTPKSLASFVAGFKSATTKRINEKGRTLAVPVWQRNYYEHVIRSDESLSKIREYIANNPLKDSVDLVLAVLPSSSQRKLSSGRTLEGRWRFLMVQFQN